MKKQLITNVFANGLSFVITAILNFILVPYYIDEIGFSAYGFIPLSMFFMAYINVITQSLVISINRNLIHAIANEDKVQCQIIFNSSFFMVAGIGIFLTVISILLSMKLEFLINIPPSLILDVKVLFVTVSINFLISLLSSILSTPLYAENRLDLIQYSSILRVVVKTISVVTLFSFFEPSLFLVAIATIVSGLVVCFYMCLFFRIYSNGLVINMRFYNKKSAFQFLHFGKWVILNDIGSLLFTKLDILLANKMFDSTAAAKISIGTQFSDLLRVFSGVVGGVTGPVVMKLHANNEKEKMLNMTKSIMLFLSLSLGGFIVLISFYADYILNIWLGDEYVDLSLLVMIVTLPLIFNLSSQPLFPILMSLGKVKVPALMNIILGLGIVLSSFTLNYFTSIGYITIAVSTSFFLLLKNLVFLPLYSSYVMNVGYGYFYDVYIKGAGYSILLYVFLGFLDFRFEGKSIFDFVFFLLFYTLISISFSLIFFKKREIVFFVGVINSLIKR